MKVQDNEELKEQIHKLESTLLDTAHKLHELRNLVDSGSGDVDAIEATAEFDKLIFDFRKVMFDGKIELEKIQKGVHKHVSHCLNPIPKTAPKKVKTKAKASARKKKDALPLPADHVDKITIKPMPTFEDSVKAVQKTVATLNDTQHERFKEINKRSKGMLTISRNTEEKKKQDEAMNNLTSDKPFE